MRRGVHRARAGDGSIAIVVVAEDGSVVGFNIIGRGPPGRRRTTKYLGPTVVALLDRARERRELAELAARSAVRPNPPGTGPYWA